MSTDLTDTDQRFLAEAIDLSRHALEDQGKTPFGAILVIGGEVVAHGTSSVVELHDPTAHAEVMALRNAGARLQRHLFPDGTMYASSEPCPMCLVACYWARLPRLVYGASTYDVGTFGFEDLQLYRELTHPATERSIQETGAAGELRTRAATVLREWADSLPFAVVPKL